ADRLRFDVLALRIVAASGERPETAVLDRKVRFAALRAGFIENHVRFFRHASAARQYFPRRLALRVAGAGQELTESSSFQSHRPAAALAWFGLGFGCPGLGVFRGRFFPWKLLCVLAIRICGTRQKAAELSPLLDHRAAALFALLVGRDLLGLKIL